MARTAIRPLLLCVVLVVASTALIAVTGAFVHTPAGRFLELLLVAAFIVWFVMFVRAAERLKRHVRDQDPELLAEYRVGSLAASWNMQRLLKAAADKRVSSAVRTDVLAWLALWSPLAGMALAPLLLTVLGIR